MLAYSAFLLDHFDDLIKIIKESENYEKCVITVSNVFGFSNEDSRYILDLPLGQEAFQRAGFVLESEDGLSES